MKWTRVFAIFLGASLAAGCNDQVPTGPSPGSASPPTTSLVLAGPNTSLGPSIEWRCLTESPTRPDCTRALQHLRTTGAGQFVALPDFAALVVPSAPSNLTFSVSGSTVNLQWAPPGAGDPPTSYTIEAGSSPGASNIVTFDTGSTAPSFTATSVPAGTYYVRIRARNAAGLSGPSNEVAISVGGQPCTSAPAAPSGLAAAVSGSTVSLTWGAAAGATSYVLEAGSSPGASNIFLGDVGPNTSMTATVSSGTYFVRMRATNACGTSGPSNEVTVVIGGPSVTILLTPINNSAIAQNDPTIGCPLHPTRGYGHRIFFDWTDSLSPYGIAGYELFAKKRDAAFPIVDTFVGSSQFVLLACNAFVVDPNLQNWEWRVRARDAQGVLSDWSTTGLFRFVPCRLPDGTACRT